MPVGGQLDYVRTVLVGETSTIGARGTFIRVKDTNGPAKIVTKQNQVGDRAGESYNAVMSKFEKLHAAKEFDEVVIDNSDPDGIDLNVTLTIGYGDYQSDVISRSASTQFINQSSIAFAKIATLVGPGIQKLTFFGPNILRKSISVRLNYLKKTAAVIDTTDAITLLASMPAIWVVGGDIDIGTFLKDGACALLLPDAANNVAGQIEISLESQSGVSIFADATYVDSVCYTIIEDDFNQ